MIAATQSAGVNQGLQALFSSIGVLIALAIVLVVGIIVYRGRKKPGSKMRAVIDAGFIAIPGVIGTIVGAVSLFIGIAYFFILFIYWLIYFIVASVWVSIVGGTVTYPAEFGQMAGLGFLYVGLGILVVTFGIVYLVLVVVRTVRRAQRMVTGTVYTVAPPPAPAAALAAPTGAAPTRASVMPPPPTPRKRTTSPKKGQQPAEGEPQALPSLVRPD